MRSETTLFVLGITTGNKATSVDKKAPRINVEDKANGCQSFVVLLIKIMPTSPLNVSIGKIQIVELPMNLVLRLFQAVIEVEAK